jgi:hypothetical protein
VGRVVLGVGDALDPALLAVAVHPASATTLAIASAATPTRVANRIMPR